MEIKRKVTISITFVGKQAEYMEKWVRELRSRRVTQSKIFYTGLQKELEKAKLGG